MSKYNDYYGTEVISVLVILLILFGGGGLKQADQMKDSIIWKLGSQTRWSNERLNYLKTQEKILNFFNKAQLSLYIFFIIISTNFIESIFF